MSMLNIIPYFYFKYCESQIKNLGPIKVYSKNVNKLLVEFGAVDPNTDLRKF
jgi:hypothetical protein